jgi:hypothetical protein
MYDKTSAPARKLKKGANTASTATPATGAKKKAKNNYNL